MKLPGAEELAPGLWRWTAYHPEWRQDVGCIAYGSGADLVLIDPMLPAEDADARRFLRALDREVRNRTRPVHVLVTIRWHKRHASEIVSRYDSRPGAELWGPSGATAKLALRGNRSADRARRLPAGVVAFETCRGEEVVLWLPRAKAVVAGDALLGGKRKPLRVCPQGWLPRGVTRSEVARSLQPLAKLPVELVLPTHGNPVRENAAEVLRQALADAG
jgi:glyoxylase-like metal-dependent hydrolase (beta-lactamase superfamily II)